MRIVQLSDIHLSINNLEDRKIYYLQALIMALKNFHSEKPIDAILFTGDLGDKGGETLGDDPYQVYRTEGIEPRMTALRLTTDHVIFVPGNHDVNRQEIEEFSESGLCT